MEALEELNEVRKESHKLSEALGQLAVEIPMVQLPSIDSAVEIDFLPNRPRRSRQQGSSGTIGTTWMPLFPILHQNLRWSTDNFEGAYASGFHEVEQERFQGVRRHLGGDVAPVYSCVDHFTFRPAPYYEGPAYLGMQIFKCWSELVHAITVHNYRYRAPNAGSMT